MKISFAKVFAVDVQHEYYTDGVSADFIIAPTRQCGRQLQRYGLIFKPSPSGFVVLCETTGEDGATTPKREILPPLALSFVLSSRSPFLFNYTNLPLDKASDQIFYLSNRLKTPIGGNLLLSADPAAGFLSASDLLALRPQRFQVDAETDNSSVLWEVVDEAGISIRRERVSSVEGTSSYFVDLTARPNGRHALRQDGVETLQFYAATELVGAYPFGLIEIAADSQVEGDFGFLESDGTIRFRRYLLKLEARKTTWEYFVVARYEKEITSDDLTVALDNPPVSFDPQPAVVLGDGSTAIRFVADTELPLRQAPIKGVALHKKKGISTPKLDIENLPNPSINEVIPSGGDKVVSRVYVYV